MKPRSSLYCSGKQLRVQPHPLLMTELRHYRADDLDVFLKKYRYVDSNNVTATTFRTSAKAGVTLATAHRYALVTCTNPDESVMAQWADRHLHTVRRRKYKYSAQSPVQFYHSSRNCVYRNDLDLSQRALLYT